MPNANFSAAEITQFRQNFLASYERELPVNAERVNAKVAAASAQHGMALASIDVGSVLKELNFCRDWPKIRRFLNFAIGVAGIFQPTLAAGAKAAIAAFNAEAFPMICQTAPPAE